MFGVEEMEQEFSQNVSKYNEASLQIKRLDTSWESCNSAASSGKFLMWKWQLDIIWRELVADVKKINPDDVIKLLNIFSEYNAKDIRDLNEKLIQKMYKSKGNAYYWALDARHIFLKELQDIVGKGSDYRASQKKIKKYVEE